MWPYLLEFGSHLRDVVLEASPWLLLGLIVAGLIRAWLPTRHLARWLGGRGLGPMVRAAVIGTPLPLCSCSVLPAAVALRRGGASKPATTAFLIATPENGADSIALSYAMLGPVMTIVRPVAACISAVATAVTVAWVDRSCSPPQRSAAPGDAPGCCDVSESSCCDASAASCCDEQAPSASGPLRRGLEGVRYAMTNLLADIAWWLMLGLLLAAVIHTFVSPDALATWGSGLPAMLLMLIVGVPMYICATASTPVAAAMLVAGVSPGTVLVFLLAGPATNLGSVGVVRRELGTSTMVAYLVGVAVTTVVLGLLLDVAVTAAGISIIAQASAAGHVVPDWLAALCAALLALMLGHNAVHWLVAPKREDATEPITVTAASAPTTDR